MDGTFYSLVFLVHLMVLIMLTSYVFILHFGSLALPQSSAGRAPATECVTVCAHYALMQ